MAQDDMAQDGPVAICTASTPEDAQTICDVLNQCGVEAHVMEDSSTESLGFGGHLSGLHTPTVWVAQKDVEQARSILEEIAQSQPGDQPSEAETDPEVGEIEVTCEACGEPSRFPGSSRGHVETCPHCGEYMDVGEEDLPDDDWGVPEGEGGEEEEEE